MASHSGSNERIQRRPAPDFEETESKVQKTKYAQNDPCPTSHAARLQNKIVSRALVSTMIRI